MRHKRKYITLAGLILTTGAISAQDYFDDIYYNPKKDKSVQQVSAKQKESTYIANMADMDVDAYNRRGEQYYVSQIDTIGSGAENGEDFVYTQQIQKYYNPTIVVDNSKALGDVLSNAYGNVDIVITDSGYPIFAPWYGWSWPYYSTWSPYWGFSIGSWGWSIGWTNPWYGWGWGPSWAWGPAWGPSWGPGWGPGWGWGPGRPPGPGPGPGWGPSPRPFATWSPGGNRAVGPNRGWAANNAPAGQQPLHRPMMNYGGNNNNIGGNRQPGGMHTSPRPTGVVNKDGRWQYNSPQVQPNDRLNLGNKVGNTGNRVGNTNPGKVSNSGHRTTNTGKTPTVNNNSNRNNNSSFNNRNNSGYRNNSHNSAGSRSTGVSRGGGGGSRGGGGGGRHR